MRVLAFEWHLTARERGAHEPRIKLQRRPCGTSAGGSCHRCIRDARLARHRFVCDGDESSKFSVQADHRLCRGVSSISARRARQLQGPLRAGRRHHAVCKRAHEPHAHRHRRLRPDRHLEQKGLQRGKTLRHAPRARHKRGSSVLLHPRLLGPCSQCRRQLRLHLRERDHRRHRVERGKASPDGRCAPGERRVVVLPVAPHGRKPLRPHLGWSAKERGPGRRHHRHRARRPGARGRPSRHAHHPALQDHGRFRLHVQHASLLGHLHLRPGVRLDCPPRWPCRHGRAQRSQGKGALRRARRKQALPRHRLA